MKLATLGMAVALAVGSVGLAYASQTNLITNGDFSSVDASLMPGGANTPTQFGSQSAYGFTAQQFIDHWQGNDGYAIWYNNASDATSTNAYSVWGQGSNHDTTREKLWAVNAPPTGTSFVGLDGDQALDGSGNQVQASIGQQLTGLIQGTKYTVSFDWGLGQLESRTGATTNSIQVSFGDLSQTTDVLPNPSHGFSGWFNQSFTFVADSSSAFLNFLAIGTPNGLPPMALLSNVSLTHAVPEPQEILGMFGGGLALIGLGVFMRRRGYRAGANA